MAGVAVAISGGIDSSVAAALLKRDGYDVFGIFMRHRFMPVLTPDESIRQMELYGNRNSLSIVRMTPEGTMSSQPYSPDLFPLPCEAAGAMETAAALDIPMTIFDADEWFKEITDDFISQYYSGKTPNPCALCNRQLKFGRLIDITKNLGADYFATGHYVRISQHADWLSNAFSEGVEVPDWLIHQDSSLRCLSTGTVAKDQSYVLFGLHREILPRLIFPLGNYIKDETRFFAQEFGLPVAHKAKKESQETCFSKNGDHIAFLHEYGGKRATSGNFVSEEGKVIGRHQGYELFTIGQRKGLGMGFGERIFVQKIDPLSHDVVLGPYDHLGKTVIQAEKATWHLEVPIDQPFVCDVKIRYRTRMARATVLVTASGNITAKLDEPRTGVAPGQSLVCYWQDRLLGGGWIV